MDILKQKEHSKKHQPHDEPIVEKEDPKVEKRSMVLVLAAIGLFVVAFVLIFLFANKSQQIPDTPDEMYLQVVTNGETDFGYMYNDYAFIQLAGMWMTRIDSHITGKNYDIPFRYGPRDVESVTIDGNPFSWIVQTQNQSQFYITFDPKGEEFKYLTLANFELSTSMVQVIGIIPVVGCTEEDDACVDSPIITCDTDQQVLYLQDRPGPPTIKKEGNCLTLAGENLELLKAVDRLLFIWYGVMPPMQISTA